MVRYVEDDAFLHVGEHDVMLVGTNLYASMGNGLQLDVSLNYPYVFDDNVKTPYGDKGKLGTILECARDGEPTFCLCFITVGYNFRPDLDKDYLEYEALSRSLGLVNVIYRGHSVGLPLLGASRFDGNGDEVKIRHIVESSLKDVDATVYLYKQLSRKEKVKKTYDDESKLKAVDREEYYKAVKKRKEEAEIRFKRNGRRRY